MNSYYEPQQNGISGLDEFGEDALPEYKYASPVYVDGVRVVGRTFEPALVAEFFRLGGKVTKCPERWARGALVFSPGWDANVLSNKNVETL